MNANNLNFKIVPFDSPEHRKILALRDKVLWKPLGLTYPKAYLLQEKNHVIVAGFLKGEVCASSVLIPKENKLQMQRVVVSSDCQNTGLGSMMLKFCESYAKEKGFKEIYAHARDRAVSFYQKNGYKVVGDYFEEEKIPHLKLTKRLG